MFCENCGAELQDSNQIFCASCGTPPRKIEGDVHINEILDSDKILLFVDHKRYRIWMWYGKNTSTRSKFIAAKQTSSIRDRFGINFKTVVVDEGNEPSEFWSHINGKLKFSCQ